MDVIYLILKLNKSKKNQNAICYCFKCFKVIVNGSFCKICNNFYYC